MINKQIKRVLIDIYTEKYKAYKGHVYFDNGQLTIYDPPHAHFEGDEHPLWIHGCEYPYVSIKAYDMKEGAK